MGSCCDGSKNAADLCRQRTSSTAFVAGERMAVYSEVVSISFRIWERLPPGCDDGDDGDCCFPAGDTISRTTSLQSNRSSSMVSCRRLRVIKSTVNKFGEPLGLRRQENLLGLAKPTSTTLFSPMATLAMDLTLNSRSAMTVDGEEGINRDSYLRAFEGPISAFAASKVLLPPKSMGPQGASTEVHSEYTFQLPTNQDG
eukprot:CAMPEP_0202469848 /NCGR_PEP_ID=MMETSP1360-20130828/79701_1 /ASSEMBLY_ACC=CAM_ASM_000848 /TAXON_ID=515479 /ORGANISM="Licmophora paradoxa, Strain CCMP2313" /LENGTH=198 /DNA_ID=CAMNT_0049095323 /DNA_START=199 /DNA_END=795 /DNA_ORIENTATION=-